MAAACGNNSNCSQLIPLVDVSQDEQLTAKQVYRACTESGFLYGVFRLDIANARVKGRTVMPDLCHSCHVMQ